MTDDYKRILIRSFKRNDDIPTIKIIILLSAMFNTIS